MENTHIPAPDSVELSSGLHAPDSSPSGGQTPPPTRPPNTSAADPNPNPVLALRRDRLEAELHAAYRRLDQSREQWVTTLTDRLVAAGNVNPWGKPFIVILDRAGEDPNEINSIALDRSTDWTVYHSIGITTGRLAKFGVACHFRQTAKDFLAPQLTRRLAQLGWAEAQSWYEFVIEAAWLEGQRLDPANAKTILADLQDTVWALLPDHVVPILDNLLEAAHPLAAERGLNGTQLFLDNRLGPLMGRHPALRAFMALSPDTQKDTRRWLIDALRWNLIYPVRGLPVAAHSNPTNPS